jgi:hypothetical protein
VKFKIEVILTATQTFEYEIEASSEHKAQDVAFDRAVDDFDISRADLSDTEYDVEQQTKECEECGVEYEVKTADRSYAADAWHEDDDYCAKCGAAIEAEEQKAGTP